MIVVAGEFVVNEPDIEAVRAAMIDMAAETAKEDGCIHYRFYQDVEHPTQFHVYEEWETLPHLDAHGQTAHMATFRGILGKVGLVSRAVKRMEVDAATPL